MRSAPKPSETSGLFTTALGTCSSIDQASVLARFILLVVRIHRLRPDGTVGGRRDLPGAEARWCALMLGRGMAGMVDRPNQWTARLDDAVAAHSAPCGKVNLLSVSG